MYHQYKEGWIEVICGCMFAGKTEELIRRINVLSYAHKKMVIFKPRIDNRYSNHQIVAHSGLSIDCIVIDKSMEIMDYINKEDGIEIIAIDEVQFLDDDIAKVCDHLANQGMRVMVAGLDKDFRGEPFGIMKELLARAEFVTKLTAVCSKCGAPATKTQRLINGKPASFYDPIVLVGATEHYEPRCRHCHIVEDKPKNF